MYLNSLHPNFYVEEGWLPTPMTFSAKDQEACAFYQEGRKHFYVAKRRVADEVLKAHISADEWPLFEEAILKETTSMIQKNQALTPLTLEESNRIRRELPERIVRSRYALRRKPVDDATGITFKAKCRWVIIGFDDPDILELEGACPTPQLQTINVFLSIAAGLGEEVYQGDFEEAFLQGRKTKRLIYVDQPKEGVPDVPAGCLFLMEKEVYGTVPGPATWRLSLVSDLAAVGYRCSKLDPCALVLTSEKRGNHSYQDEPWNPFREGEWLVPPETVGPEKGDMATFPPFEAAEGRIIILTDDVLDAGNSRHRGLMTALQQKYRFGR